MAGEVRILNPGAFLRLMLFYVLPFMLAVLFCPLLGSEQLDFASIYNGLWREQWSVDAQIFFFQRIPRVLLACCVGGTLAMTGAVFQVILRNPLAEPFTLGVTGGGAVGASLAFFFPWLVLSFGPFSTVQFFSLAGSSIILIVIYRIAMYHQRFSMSTLLLAGVTLGITCGSLILLLRYLAHPHQLVVMDRWLMGGLDVIGYGQLTSLLPLLLPGLGLLALTIPSLNHLALGRDMATGQGVDVRTVQKFAFLGGSMATAAVVSLAGPIGFVGLIVPHAVRKMSGQDQRAVVPASFLLGGAFLAGCDTLARTVIAPMEMPVGVITALLGGPFFLYLLITHRQHGWR